MLNSPYAAVSYKSLIIFSYTSSHIPIFLVLKRDVLYGLYRSIFDSNRLTKPRRAQHRIASALPSSLPSSLPSFRPAFLPSFAGTKRCKPPFAVTPPRSRLVRRERGHTPTPSLQLALQNLSQRREQPPLRPKRCGHCLRAT